MAFPSFSGFRKAGKLFPMVGKSSRVAWYAFLFALSCVACSDDDEGEATESGTCNGLTLGYNCTEYEGSPSFIDDVRQTCEELGDAWTTEPCPTADLVGCCRETFGSDVFLGCYYTGYPGTPMELEEQCTVEFGGSWTTGTRG